MQSGYNLSDLVEEAKTRWLKPPEVLFILQNYEDHQLTNKPPQKPTGGSLFLFNKRVLRFFRKDGHSWRRKKDGRTVGEAHERLKVGNAEALNCYYAHGDVCPNFQRRSYWMLDPAYEHIVLVHYRDITEGRHSGRSILQSSSGSYSTLTQSPSSQVPASTAVVSEFQTIISSPDSLEVGSTRVINSDRMINHSDIIETNGEIGNSSALDISRALRSLEEQLSLGDDSLDKIGTFSYGNENSNDAGYIVDNQGEEHKEHYLQTFEEDFLVDKETAIWNEMLDSSNNSAGVGSNKTYDHTLNGNQAIPLPPSRREPVEEEQESSQWMHFGGNNAHSCDVSQLPTFMSLPLELEDFSFSAYPPALNISSDQYTTIFEQGLIGMPLEETSSLTVAEKQKFSIHEISPDWGYANEATKVIIVGSFLCDPSDCAWNCMFGDIEVPTQIIGEGVIRCHAPPNLPGKVTLCITSGNRESCSEVTEFDYRANPSNWAPSNFPETESSKNSEVLLLLVKFVQMLLLDPSIQRKEISESGIDLLEKVKAGKDSWAQVIESPLDGTWTSSSTTNWLLEELLKDKLQQWLSSRRQEGMDLQGYSLSKKDQGVIHMVAGLGFEWALNPILNSGVGVDFRDINGLTALHWAARFGREKMVAALLASGASARAVTDPTSQDPIGKTPASMAATNGHKGLAGYLSEVSLTSHLSSLTLVETELSKNSADVEAERTVNNISNMSFNLSEDQLSLKDTLDAVRNATQAAARIQAAFRAHSFRKRQQKQAAARGDEYAFLSSKLAFPNTRDYNAAALSIQKKYRGWRGRKDFLAFRRKVVKIQAHVRGHQVRKNYKVICWAVSVLEKIVLRWRRRGGGLRGFHLDSESIDESEDEDIVKVFRKEKVEAAINEAVSRVLSMVKSPDAREQYRRMLEKYRQAKAALGIPENEAGASSSSQGGDMSDMENYDIYSSLV